MSTKDRFTGYAFIALWALMAYFPAITMNIVADLGLSRQMDTIESTATYLSFIFIMGVLCAIWAIKCIEVGAKLCTQRPRTAERAEFEKQLWKAK